VNTLPESVTIPEGATTATFPITTAFGVPSGSAAVSAIYGTTAAISTFEVLPSALESIRVEPSGVEFGESPTGTVKLRHPAPQGGALIRLTSDDAAVSV